VDQLHYMFNAVKKVKEEVSEKCEKIVKELNEISFEGYPNFKHPELILAQSQSSSSRLLSGQN